MLLFRKLGLSLFLSLFFIAGFAQDTIRFFTRDYHDTAESAAYYHVSVYNTDSIPDTKWRYPNSKRMEVGPFNFQLTGSRPQKIMLIDGNPHDDKP